MYNQVINPSIDIYNADTGEFLGTSTFDLSSYEEKKLLNYLNRGESFSDLLLLNARLYNAPKDYVPPTIDRGLRRVGVLHALFRDDTGVDVPIEIRMKFLSQARGVFPGDPYFLSSVLYSDIIVESVNRMVSSPPPT